MEGPGGETFAWTAGAAAAAPRPHAVATLAATAARALSRRKRRRLRGVASAVRPGISVVSIMVQDGPVVGGETKDNSHWQDISPAPLQKSGRTLISVRHSPTITRHRHRDEIRRAS